MVGVGVGDARPPSFTISTITYKVVVYALAEKLRGQIHSPYFYPTLIFILWGKQQGGGGVGLLYICHLPTYKIFAIFFEFTKKQTDKVPYLRLKNLNMKQNIDSRGKFFSGFKGCLFFITGKENVYCFTPG